MPSVPKDTRQFYSPFGEWYLLLQVILLRSGIAFGSLSLYTKYRISIDKLPYSVGRDDSARRK